MIEVRDEPLPMESEKRLREWLLRSEYDTLMRVLESRVKVAQAAFLRVQLDLEKHPNHQVTSDDHMRMARRFRTAIEVIQELRDQSETFTIAKLL